MDIAWTTLAWLLVACGGGATTRGEADGRAPDATDAQEQADPGPVDAKDAFAPPEGREVDAPAPDDAEPGDAPALDPGAADPGATEPEQEVSEPTDVPAPDAEPHAAELVEDVALSDAGGADGAEPVEDVALSDAGEADEAELEASGAEDMPDVPDGEPEVSDVQPEVADGADLVDAGPLDAGTDLGPADTGSPLVQSGLCAGKTLDPWSRKIRGAGGALVFNEIMYHPAGGGDAEWVELWNPMAVDLDISGWRLDGGISFAFPEGTLVRARGYLVVAADPLLLAQTSGYLGALGPYSGHLSNGGEDVELRSNTDRLMDRVDYDDSEPWSVLADGSGASLAKPDPVAPSERAESWGPGAPLGGTPGQPNLAGPGTPPQGEGLLLHEVAGAGAPFWIELVNAGSAPAQLKGRVLALSSGAQHVLPAHWLEPGGVLLLDDTQLGFQADEGDKLFLYAPARAEVLDCVEVRAVPRGRAVPGAGPWLYPDTSSPGQPNQIDLPDQVVIHEIMYHDGPVDAPDGTREASPLEWIELHNRGMTPVDVGEWQLVDDVAFVIPAGTVIPPEGYLVLAGHADEVAAAYPGLAVVGDWEGRLANAGATIGLRDACGNPVDQVTWFDGGRWPSFADGTGASLELRDAWADNDAPEAWAASDESATSPWRTYTYEGPAQPSAPGPDGRWQEFVLGLLDAGVVLLDDVSVIADPGGAAVELIQDGGFESGAAQGWRLLGTHRHSEVIEDPSDPGQRVLRLVATGPTEHMHNHAETTLAVGHTITDGRIYRISFRARWMAGSNQLHTRLYFTRLARTTLLARPAPGGTPGAPNSTCEASIGPTYRDFGHDPAVPAPLEPVRVSVRADDPDGVAGLVLWVRIGGGEAASLPLVDQGQGRFEALVPGQEAGTIVQVWVEGYDLTGARSAFPAGGAASRALWKVDDGLAATNGLHNLRIVMSAEDAAWLHDPIQVMSNDRVGATVIYDERQAFYDVGVRIKGSERGRNQPKRVGFAIRFHAEQPFRGVHQGVMVDRSEGVHFGQREMLINQVMSHAGSLSAEYNDLVFVMAPLLAHTSAAELQLARFGDLLLDFQFEQGGDGDVYEYELIYYPTTTDDGTPQGYKLPEPDLVMGTPIRDLGPDKEAYRFPFSRKNNRWSDDYQRLMAFAGAFGQTGAAFHDAIGAFIDVDQWLRAFAFGTLSGAIDCYASGAQHNTALYVRPADQRVLLFPHDMDFYQASPLRPVVGSADLARLIEAPANRRAYYAHLYDIIRTSYNAGYMAYWCGHYGALLPEQDFAGHLQYITERAEWVLHGAPDAITVAVPEVPFEIATNGGDDVQSAPAPALTLEGSGWLDVDEIWRMGDGQALDVAWPGPSTWQVVVPLVCGPNPIVLLARSREGLVLASDAITVSVTGDGCP